jgi:hypothetical protein
MAFLFRRVIRREVSTRGGHVFTDPEGLRQLMDDVDAATKVMGEWLQKAGLSTGEGTPT